jgi:Putative zinc-finger
VSATGVDHRDVAAFALGILDDQDAMAFEAHLADCARCAAELEGFLDLSTALSDADLDADTVVASVESTEDGKLLQRLMNSVEYQRTKVRTMRIMATAAAVVVVAGVAVTGVFAGQQMADRPGTTTQAAASPTPSEAPTGGPAGRAGDPLQKKYPGTNASTKVSAKAEIVSRNWGSEFFLEVRNLTVDQPLACQLVVRTSDGGDEIAGIWTVPVGEFGTRSRPVPLTLAGLGKAKAGQIKRLELRVNGTGPLIVGIDVR